MPPIGITSFGTKKEYKVRVMLLKFLENFVQFWDILKASWNDSIDVFPECILHLSGGLWSTHNERIYLGGFSPLLAEVLYERRR
jgi:hypothetical protein